MQAIEYYQRALTTVADFRGTQFPLFESISKDLAGIYLTYAIRLQDNVQPGMVVSHPAKVILPIIVDWVKECGTLILIRAI